MLRRTAERRPGVRRLDHLLRLIGEGDDDGARAVVSALERVVPRVAPAVLLSALGAIRTRNRERVARVFFPKGATAKTHVVDDDRPALPATHRDQRRKSTEAQTVIPGGRASAGGRRRTDLHPAARGGRMEA
ncbi:hypothetical protein [Streptomyces sp. NPDC000880]